MAALVRGSRMLLSAAGHGHGHGAAHHATNPVLAHELEETLHAQKAKETWKNISFYLAIPACFLVAGNAYYLASKHSHDDHHDDHHEEPKLYGTYLRIRNKPFPFGNGDQTLFWNEHVNH